MLIIPIKDGENIDRALKRFKRKFDKTGLKKSLQTRKEFIKSSVKKIDLLSLDVEGMELNVLQGIDFKKVYIKYILVETENFNKINDYLLNYKYKFLEKFSIHDYLFIQEE